MLYESEGSWSCAEPEYNGDYAAEAPYEGGTQGIPYGDEFTEITENAFVSVREQPLSTFSADVDTASYSYLRRMIESGWSSEWFSKDSVRIEEMLNYFSYDYHGPRAGEPFGVNTEIAACPWNEESYLLQIGLQTEAIDFSDAPPSNLVFLIDVSGSMYDEDKLPLLQQSFAMLASNLTARDRVSIVTYAGEDEVVLTGAKGSETDRIVNALNALEASGSTNGSAGIMTAYSIAQDYFIEGGNNRIILATDGDLNVGLTSVEELENLVETERRSGVFLTVLGFGMGNLKDNRMETLADKGNGNYAYIDSLSEARKVLVEELGATLVTVAKDVKLQVEFNSDIVSEYRLIGYENRALAAQDFSDDTKDAGEIGAGHSVTALYEVRLVRGTMQSALSQGNVGTLHIRCKKPDGDRSVQFDYEIGRESYG
ncbi:MAG: VWA domain-containing protein, partial [Lachnospiraceae bacterium]|nr:VWA domain-containing protein [Lachnospiraceae bacterium]